MRNEHQRLAGRRRSWPRFDRPPELAAVDRTILDVALAASPAEHRDALSRWARSVWNARGRKHAAVAALYAGTA